MASQFLMNPKSKFFLAGFLAAALLFGGTAVAYNVNNTPQGGYLLCVNNKSRVVTFPGSLRCPKGTTAIQIPGSDQIAAGTPKEPKQESSSGNDSSDNKSDPKCNLDYLRQNQNEIKDVISKCSMKQLSALQDSLAEADAKLQDEVARLTKQIEEKRKTGSQSDIDALSTQITELIANSKIYVIILGQSAGEISKRIRG